MGSGYWLLSTPYSLWARKPNGLNLAFQEAAKVRGRLIQAGVATFCPIVHSHPVAMICGIPPLEGEMWGVIEAPIRACAKGMIVVRMDGWAHSSGIEAERAEFEAAGKPIVYMDPEGKIPPELLDE